MKKEWKEQSKNRMDSEFINVFSWTANALDFAEQSSPWLLTTYMESAILLPKAEKAILQKSCNLFLLSLII